jgi:hypothetical protein
VHEPATGSAAGREGGIGMATAAAAGAGVAPRRRVSFEVAAPGLGVAAAPGGGQEGQRTVPTGVKVMGLSAADTEAWVHAISANYARLHPDQPNISEHARA